MRWTDKGPALELVLKHKWFQMIKDRIKKEEYRDTSDYWVKRLFCLAVSRKDDDEEDIIETRIINQATLDEMRREGKDIVEEADACRIVPRWCGDVIFYDGYAKDRESITVEIADMNMREGNPKWGAEPGKVYIVIELGEIISNG